AEDGGSHWLSSEQQRLEEMALDAMVRLGEAELARGDQTRAMTLAKRGMAINELREDALRLFMRAAAAGGRKAEALQQYDLLAALLKRRLEIEPDVATRRLADEIRAQGAAVAARAPPAPVIAQLGRLDADWTGQPVRAVLALDGGAARSLKSAGNELVAKSRLRAQAAAEICDARTDELGVQVEDRSGKEIRAPGAPVHTHRPMCPKSKTPGEGRIAGSQILPAIAVVPFSVSNSHSSRNIIGQLLAHEIIARL